MHPVVLVADDVAERNGRDPWLVGVGVLAAFQRGLVGGAGYARRPRLLGLVLVGTGARLRVLPRILELLRQAPQDGRGLIASLSYSPRTPPEMVVEAERALAETPAPVTLGDYLACDRFDAMVRLPAVRAPTLVVVGRDDRLTPPKYSAFLASTIPGARLVEVDDAGHFPQLEQPTAVNAALRAFLASLPDANEE